MKFSEAIEQYLDARERLEKLNDGPEWPTTPRRRERIGEEMRQAAEVMDKLAPGDA